MPPPLIQQLLDLGDLSTRGDDGERTEVLARGGAVRIERIVSTGQGSPPGFWYDQDEDEWVAVLAGRAGLEIAGGGILVLGPGDAVHLPAHRRHRVAWTADDEPTVWLAVFYPATP